ncbi:MAG: hypothetical protein WCE38_07980 [Burkholderiales bacterium]
MIGPFSPSAAGARWASGLARTLAFFAALCICTSASAGEPVAPDARITSTAHLLAGMGTDYKPHAQIAALDAWQKHRKQLAPRWARLQRERLSVIEAWRNDALRAELDRCQTLLYPFSGPDFLNAYVLFPRCDTYVLFGLEAPGDVPALEGLSAEDAAALLDDTRVALKDLLARNYFITKHMSEQLKTPRLTGVLPLMLASMSLLDLRVAAVEPFDLAQFPGPRPAASVNPARRAKGVKVTYFRPPAGKPQTLYYLSLDVTDRALRANPEFLPFLKQFKPSMTFIKSASYLLQAKEFAGTLQTLLDVSEVLVQDDTGIPYARLRDRNFEISLFGRYEPPISEFPNAYQNDLAAAYQQSENVSALPFSFGYHWKPGTSALIIARNTAKRS